MVRVVKSLFYFILAGVFEIGGGYMIWLWLRDGKAWWYGVLGAVILIFYGIIPTLQPESADFGKVYAAYGGILIVLSILWGWKINHVVPDFYDMVGGIVALVGVAIIMYAPRS